MEVKYRGIPPEERVANRLRDSGGGYPGDVNVHKGQGPTRVNEHHHHSGSNHGSTTHTEFDEGKGE
jgi:hypothetical protein